jgi:hypothetical protein
MDSPLSETPETVGQLRHAVWHGDWNDAADLAAALARADAPLTQAGLEDRLNTLLEMLTVAKARRLEMVSSLSRLRAIAEFSAPEVQTIV